MANYLIIIFFLCNFISTKKHIEDENSKNSACLFNYFL